VIQPMPPDDERPSDTVTSELLSLHERAASIRERLAELARQLAVRLGEIATGDEPEPEQQPDNPRPEN